MFLCTFVFVFDVISIFFSLGRNRCESKNNVVNVKLTEAQDKQFYCPTVSLTFRIREAKEKLRRCKIRGQEKMERSDSGDHQNYSRVGLYLI